MDKGAGSGLRIAVVGAGPVGLATALLSAQRLPAAQISLFDARPGDRDVSGDARALALSLGSVQLLQRLGTWPAALAAPIREVHVSQAPPSFGPRWAVPELRIRAEEEGVEMLGAVLAYGQLVTAMQQVWIDLCVRQPQRLHPRFGVAVTALKDLEHGVEVDAGVVETFDLVVQAEGGVFGAQTRKAVSRDYGQSAWVGQVSLEDAKPGLAVERFTPSGPIALLPLVSSPAGPVQASLVWCTKADNDAVAPLDDAQRIAVLNSLLPATAGRVVAISQLTRFALGLNAEPTLVRRRQIRIGNAAQTLHPVAGQGLNLGLRDVFGLVDALAGSTDVDRSLRRVEWTRAPDRWSMIATIDFLARSFTWSGLGAVRGAALALLQAATPLKSALARQMMFGQR